MELALVGQKQTCCGLIGRILNTCGVMTNHTNHCQKAIILKARQTSIISLIKGMDISAFLQEGIIHSRSVWKNKNKTIKAIGKGFSTVSQATRRKAFCVNQETSWLLDRAVSSFYFRQALQHITPYRGYFWVALLSPITYNECWSLP